jgi:hypothetical protein
LSQDTQTRWGQPYQIWPSTAAPIPNPINGWQQQSKWRRKIQQQALNGIPPVVVSVGLNTAQVSVQAYSPTVLISGEMGWQPQSKWRRPIQQQALNGVTPTLLGTAQIIVQAYPVTPTVTATPITSPSLPQARWGQPYQIQPYYTQVAVPLPQASITVRAYPVTVVLSGGPLVQGWQQQSKWRRKYQVRQQSGLQPTLGSGAPGLIKITYPIITGQLLYSVSGLAQVDQYGNQLPRGYQGPLSAFQPLVSTPTVTETWHQLSLVSAQATASGNGINGFWYIYRSNGEVELLWDITATNTGGAYIAVMPKGYIPLVQQNIPSGWYGTAHSTYQSNFQPHLNIQCITDPVPGAIYTYGGNVQPLGFFGRAKYILTAV